MGPGGRGLPKQNVPSGRASVTRASVTRHKRRAAPSLWAWDTPWDFQKLPEVLPCYMLHVTWYRVGRDEASPRGLTLAGAAALPSPASHGLALPEGLVVAETSARSTPSPPGTCSPPLA